ncbi:MAG: dihydrofolate reductase family protein [Thermoplasmatales archaeon]|nr:dihydrofolate reductase family protein [Thermoplasmatales archaeon]
MQQNIILHNSISLDGSLTNFEVNMELHYKIAAKYKPDAHLIGSNTIESGIKLYGNNSSELKKDFNKPKRNKDLPYWIIIDTKGKLINHLHEIRRFEFCRDVIILISKETKNDYIEYLKLRNYDYHVVGGKKVIIKKSLKLLKTKYNIDKILTDTGRILGNILLQKDFVSEISLLIHPIIVGDNVYTIFSDMLKSIDLELLKKEILHNNYIWVVYKIK